MPNHFHVQGVTGDVEASTSAGREEEPSEAHDASGAEATISMLEEDQEIPLVLVQGIQPSLDVSRVVA